MEYRFVILRADGSERLFEVLTNPSQSEIEAKELEYKGLAQAGERYGYILTTPPRVVSSVSSDVNPIEAIGGMATESVVNRIVTRS